MSYFLPAVWKCDETLSQLFDILRKDDFHINVKVVMIAFIQFHDDNETSAF